MGEWLESLRKSFVVGHGAGLGDQPIDFLWKKRKNPHPSRSISQVSAMVVLGWYFDFLALHKFVKWWWLALAEQVTITKPQKIVLSILACLEVLVNQFQQSYKNCWNSLNQCMRGPSLFLFETDLFLSTCLRHWASKTRKTLKLVHSIRVPQKFSNIKMRDMKLFVGEKWWMFTVK